MELQLVAQLGTIPPQEVELDEPLEVEERRCVPDAQKSSKPGLVRREMLEQEGITLGDRDISEISILNRQPSVTPSMVLGMTCLVQQGIVVVVATMRHDHQLDLTGNPYGRHEGPRRLLWPLLYVQLDVLLPVEINPHTRQGPLQYGEQTLLRKHSVELLRPEDKRQVVFLSLLEGNPSDAPEEVTHPISVEPPCLPDELLHDLVKRLEIYAPYLREQGQIALVAQAFRRRMHHVHTLLERWVHLVYDTVSRVEDSRTPLAIRLVRHLHSGKTKSDSLTVHLHALGGSHRLHPAG